MEKKYKRVLIVLLVIILVGIGAISIAVSSFADSGIQVLGRFVHIDIREKCYFVSPGGEIQGESTLTISGLLLDEWGSEYGSFDGYVSVEGYPLSSDILYSAFSGQITWGKIFVDNDSAEMLRPGEDTFTYHISIIRGREPIVVARIEEPNGEAHFAICADSEEEAIAKWHKYYGD